MFHNHYFDGAFVAPIGMGNGVGIPQMLGSFFWKLFRSYTITKQ